MPTAERACRPRSPKTSTNRSEQPLMTSGCWPNSGVALTMPSTLTMRFTRSRSPSSAFITAIRLSPVAGMDIGRSMADRAPPCRPARACRATPGPSPRVEKIAGAHRIDVVRHRRRGWRQLDGELLQPLLGLHHSLLQSAFTRARKAPISSVDFTPRVASTPEDVYCLCTCCAHRVSDIVGREPARQEPRHGHRSPRQHRPVEGARIAAGQDAFRSIEHEPVGGDAGIGPDAALDILRDGNLYGFHRRLAGASLDGGHACRGSAP